MSLNLLRSTAEPFAADGVVPVHAVDEWLLKKLDHHVAAVGLYVASYNLCRTHESPAHDASEGHWRYRSRMDHCRNLLTLRSPLPPAMPTETPPDRRRKFAVIEGGR